MPIGWLLCLLMPARLTSFIKHNMIYSLCQSWNFLDIGCIFCCKLPLMYWKTLYYDIPLVSSSLIILDCYGPHNIWSLLGPALIMETKLLWNILHPILCISLQCISLNTSLWPTVTYIYWYISNFSTYHNFAFSLWKLNKKQQAYSDCCYFNVAVDASFITCRHVLQGNVNTYYSLTLQCSINCCLHITSNKNIIPGPEVDNLHW